MTSRRHILEHFRTLGWSLLVGVGAILVTLAADGAGFVDAGDTVVRAQYYGLASPKQDRQQVILVEGNASTAARWGPPPWPQSQLELLEAAISRGNPIAIGRIAPDRLSRASERQSVPAASTSWRFDLGGSVQPKGRAVETLSLTRPDRDAIEHLAIRGRLVVPPGVNWPIHYLSPPTRLPRVAAHRVLSNEIPAEMFTGRIVLIGVTSATHADSIPTPVGDLTSAEIIAHALTGVANGQVWRVPSPVLVATMIFLLSSFVAWRLRTQSPGRAVWTMTVVIAVGVVLDFLLFAEGIALVGVSQMVIAILAVSFIHLVANHNATHRVLTQFSNQVAISIEHQREEAPAIESFWQDLVDIAHAYLDYPTTGFLAEIPPDSWRLELRSAHGANADDLLERRQDIRRPPFRTSYLTQRASFTKRRVIHDSEVSTVVVPLAWKRRLYGMWLVNVPREMATAGLDLKVLERTAAHMAHAVFDRRNREPAPLSHLSQKRIEQLETIRRAVNLVQENRAWAVKALQKLPTGILVADMWARIRFLNRRMAQVLESDFPDGVPQEDLRAVLARTLDGTLQDAHDLMRMVLRTGVPVEIGRPDSPGHSSPRYMLRRLDLDAHDEGGDRLPPLLLLVTYERNDAERVVWSA